MTPTRLLYTRTGQFRVFTKPSVPPRYAILSHVWNVGGEQSYTDTRDIQRSLHPSSWRQAHASNAHAQRPQDTELHSCLDHLRMSEKIRRACAVAQAHGHQYLWIDSCCIDKTSSAELSEAINSMFSWYHNASVCYTYLADVPSDENPRADRSAFRRSRWFTRGWTLQELLAPTALIFLSRDWQVIGTKSSLADVIESITDIPSAVLTHHTPLRDVSVATRMSWSSQRKTTRVEDEAYSLMGIFDINMPTLYGEGRRAFIRLQEEILKRIPDQTLFAWGPRISWRAFRTCSPSYTTLEKQPFFATSAVDFASCGAISPISQDQLASRLGLEAGLPLPVYTTSSYGVHARLPLISCDHLMRNPEPAHPSSPVHRYLAVWACEARDGSLLASVCHTDNASDASGNSAGLTLHSGTVTSLSQRGRLVILSPDELRAIRERVRLKDVYLNPGYFQSIDSRPRRRPRPDAHVFKGLQRIHLAPWSREVLRSAGYTVARCHLGQPSLAAAPTRSTRSLILHDGREYIDINIHPWAMSAQVRWLDSDEEISEVDTDRLHLLTTVLVPGRQTVYRKNLPGTSTGHSEFVRSPGGPCACTVTVTYTSESLWMLDISIAPKPLHELEQGASTIT
ncbi:heterokaryon incompatibility protein-domain-containing protein [Cerioporus squamosus]|nr:heterokaryon incompatibility protein-domain-containing protein [Cerioporus squamosus]